MIHWLSRHPLTAAQKVTLEAAGHVGEVKQTDLVFGADPSYQVEKLGAVRGDTLAVVAPLEVALGLLRDGFVLVTFSNAPSARAKGVFVCKGC